MWQDGGVCRGAEPQVSQHLHHEDTGHVDQDGERETQSLRWPQPVPRVTYLLWYNSWGWLDAIGVFTLTPVEFQATKVLKFSFLLLLFSL